MSVLLAMLALFAYMMLREAEWRAAALLLFTGAAIGYELYGRLAELRGDRELGYVLRFDTTTLRWRRLPAVPWKAVESLAVDGIRVNEGRLPFLVVGLAAPEFEAVAAQLPLGFFSRRLFPVDRARRTIAFSLHGLEDSPEYVPHMARRFLAQARANSPSGQR